MATSKTPNTTDDPKPQMTDGPIADGPSSPKRCGIVMPISASDGYTEAHWRDVKAILVDAASDVGLKADLVSEAEDVGIIHKRIVENLYFNPIVICDVSSRNPNVMFELGMRLAFDKPTVIVKDEATPYSFDTSLVEHIPYRRDLRYADTVLFKEAVGKKLKKLFEKAGEGAFSPFLANVGKLRAVSVPTEQVSPHEYELASLRASMDETQRMVRVMGDQLSLLGGPFPVPLGFTGGTTATTAYTLPDERKSTPQRSHWKRQVIKEVASEISAANYPLGDADEERKSRVRELVFHRLPIGVTISDLDIEEIVSNVLWRLQAKISK